MVWILFACTVGSTEPATSNSVNGIESAKLAEFSKEAGRLANRSRDLERIAKEAVDALPSGGERQSEIEKIEATLKEMEAINSALQQEHADLNQRIRQAAQSTADTRE